VKKRFQFINKMATGLAILLAATAFQVSANDSFTDAEISASPYLQSVLKRKGETYDATEFLKEGPIGLLWLPKEPVILGLLYLTSMLTGMLSNWAQV